MSVWVKYRKKKERSKYEGVKVRRGRERNLLKGIAFHIAPSFSIAEKSTNVCENCELWKDFGYLDIELADDLFIDLIDDDSLYTLFTW